MKYQVIARKFRPQVFGEVVGQKPILQTLQNAVRLDRTGHAYLFSGPRGTGKTTTARIFAKALNCVNGPTITPCNECPSCKEIAAGQSMDVLEIDAASNTGVDSVRELRDSARYAPSRDRSKIFIIDEVHMLSTSAFNALLKILEEPPPHVVFIMATTERHKLPATILSRCQQFVFRTISPGEIQAHLREIATREGAKIDDRGLSYIVKAAEGSMRDAQSLLDQIISFGGQDVANDDVRDVLGFIPSDILDRTVDAIAESNSRELIETVGIVVDQGLSLQQFARELIARMRDLLMMKLKLAEKVLGGDEEKKALAQRAESFSEQDLIRFFDLLLRLEGDVRYSSQPRLHLEVGLVKLAKAGHMRDIEEVLRDLRQGGSPSTTATPTPATTRPSGASGPAAQAVPPRPKAAAAPAIPQAAPAIPKIDIPRPAPASTPPPKPAPTPPPAAAAPAPATPPAAAEPTTKSDIIKPPDGPKAAERRAAISNLNDAAKQDLFVKSFLETFRGDIAQVKPPKGEDDK